MNVINDSSINDENILLFRFLRVLPVKMYISVTGNTDKPLSN